MKTPAPTVPIERNWARRGIAPLAGLPTIPVVLFALIMLTAIAQAQPASDTTPQDDDFPDLLHSKMATPPPPSAGAPPQGEMSPDLTKPQDAPSAANGTVTGNWTLSESGTTSDLKGVTWGGNVFVAVGAKGAVLTSHEGAKWTGQSSNTTHGLFDVAWNGALYVSVGDDGTILTSPDGAKWTAQSSGVTNGLVVVNWEQNQFIAAGENGTILTSPDGVKWTACVSGIEERLYGIAGNGRIVVVVGDMSSVLTSSDGLEFTLRTASKPIFFHRLIWAKTQFVATTSNLALRSPTVTPVHTRADILTSPDGVIWTSHPSYNPRRLTGIAWNGRWFIAVGGAIVYSADGKTWAQTTGSVPTVGAVDVACNDREFVAVSDKGAIIRLVTPVGGS